MADKGNYNWHDGKGKVHSRPKRKSSKGSAGSENPDYFNLALKMAQAAYAPAIKQVRNEAMATKQQMAPGGGLDVAYDRQATNIANSQKQAADFATAQVAQSKQFGEGMVGALGSVQQEEIDRQRSAAQLYGRTAEAAEQASKTATAQLGSQTSRAGGATGLLSSMAINQQGASAGQTAANEGFRGQARTQMGHDYTKLIGELADLRTKRGASASDQALALAKADRDFKLAQQSLNVKNTDSLRDYKATLAGIEQQANALSVNDENTDADRATDNANSDADRTSRESIARADRIAARAEARRKANQVTPLDLARFDVNKNGRLDPGEAVGLNLNGSAKGSGGSSVYVGRDNKPFHTTAAGRTDFVNRRLQINSMKDALADGRLRSGRDLQKVTKLNHLDNRMFDFIVDYKRRLDSKDPNIRKYPIQRTWLNLLKAYFKMEGQLPSDIAGMVVPPGKK